MKSIKPLVARAGIALTAVAGYVSATTVSIPTIDINMTAALAPIIDLMSALPTILVLLIPIALVMVVIMAIYAVGNFVLQLLHKSANVPSFGKHK